MDQLAGRNRRLDGIEEADELLMAMPLHTATQGLWRKLGDDGLRRAAYRGG
jgi:hypothetical protein